MGRVNLAKDPDTLIEMWKLQGSPFFAIIQGKNEMIFRHEDDSMDAAESKLRETLNYICNSSTAGEFVLRSYDDGDKIVTSKPYFGSIPFKFHEYPPFTRTNGDNGVIVVNGAGGPRATQQHTNTDPALLAILEAMKNEISDLKQRIEEYEEEEDPEEDPEEYDEEAEINKKVEMYTRIGSTVVSLLTPVLERFFPGTQQQNTNVYTPAAPAADTIGNTMNDNEILAKAVQQMTAVIGHEEFVKAMQRLGQIAETQPDVFKNLLKML